MKRIVILLFLCLSTAKKSFCVDWKRELRLSFISDKSVELRVVEAGNNYFRDNNFLCIQYNLEMPIDKLGCKELESAEKINALCYRSKMDIFSDFELKDDGFLYGKIANEPFSYNPVREIPVIFGNEFSFAIPGMTSWLKIGTKEYEDGLYSDDSYKNKEKRKHKYNDFYNYAIKNVNSSTHLIETRYGIEFDYSGLNLDSFLYEIKGYWGQHFINPYCFPWVENADGPGICEWIEFELNSLQSITYILNGFVDGHRMHLYKANSRLKEAEITGWTENGKEIKQNVHFEDFVYFKTVQFSESVTKFRITIKEVYPGEKWQDTCISAVMFPVEKK